MVFAKVASTKDLPSGKMLAAHLGEKNILVVNMQGKYYAIGNICTHDECLLSDGQLGSEGTVECPCHGTVFDVRTGSVLHGPARDPEPSFEVRAEGDEILVNVPGETVVKKPLQRGIVLASDNPQAVPDFAEEYGRPLGLRGTGQGLSFLNNFKALSKYKLKTRLITKHREPVLETSFFGRKLSMPVLGASMSGLSYTSSVTEDEFLYSILEGCRLAGTIGYTGHTSKDYTVHPGIAALRRVQGDGVNIFKPQSQEVLLGLMKQSEAEQAVAVGVDIDGAGSVNFARAGKPVYRKSIGDLKELKQATRLPFIVKGVMCVEDALAAVEAGVDVVGVSNHGGRVLDSTPGVADVLPRIVSALHEEQGGRRIVITADGGVRTGYDAMKLLALGADYVLVGRPLAMQALSSGRDGVMRVLDYIRADMRKAMIMTSCNSLEEIDERVLDQVG